MRGSPKFIPSPSWSSKFLVHVHENHANPATLPQPFYHTHFYTHHLSLTNLHVSFMHATPLSSNTNCHLSTLYPLCISIIPIITHYTHQTILLSSFLTLDFLHTHKPISPFIQHFLSLYTTPPSYPLLGALHIHSLHPSTAMHGHALVMLFSTYLGSHASFITSTSLHPYLIPHACHSPSPHTHLFMLFIPRTMQGPPQTHLQALHKSPFSAMSKLHVESFHAWDVMPSSSSFEYPYPLKHDPHAYPHHLCMAMHVHFYSLLHIHCHPPYPSNHPTKPIFPL